jgi:hypothetical protein
VAFFHLVPKAQKSAVCSLANGLRMIPWIEGNKNNRLLWGFSNTQTTWHLKHSLKIRIVKRAS